jgi:hypothetical protein
MRQMIIGLTAAGWMAVWLAGCGRDEPAAEAGAPPAAEAPAAEATPSGAAEVETAPADPAAAAPVEIDPASLDESARVEIHEYQVAFIGSGTLGKGTLHAGGAQHPFRIGGLGIGGIGVAKIDAEGTVYDLARLEDFAGTYGNARVGATAADKGKGRLWLKNTKGVVLELRSKMQGLALTAGVDGIVITWEKDYQDKVGAVKEGAQEAWQDTKEGAAEAYEKSKDAVRGVVD